MSSRIELLEQAQALLEQMGVEMRQQWDNAAACGLCRIDSRWILFADVTRAYEEQMDELIDSILTVSESEQFEARPIPISDDLRRALVAAAKTA